MTPSENPSHFPSLAEAFKDLVAARQRAEEASRAKSAFLASISHEIRTHLNALLGMAELLSETSLDSTQRRYVEVFRRAGANLLALVNDILDLSKVESGHFELEIVEFQLADVIDRSIEMVPANIRSKDVAVSSKVAPEVPAACLGDPVRLQQILLNLLTNAVKFTKQGEIVLIVEQLAIGLLRFSVSDTGIGIAPEKLTTIFDDFAQADSSTARKYGGTGLGLGICRRLVHCMGGELTAKSELGKGSTFSFTAKLPAASTKEQPLECTGSARPAVISHRNLRILIVDDSPDNCLLLQVYLAGTSHSLTFAENGQIALDEFAATSFDLILIDTQMPLLDGLAATSAIRNLERQQQRPPVPILALSASALPEDVEASLRAGCTGHLAKPISKSTLLAAIERYTQSSQAGEITISVPEGLAELAGPYLEARRQDLLHLRQSLEQSNYVSLVRLAHRIKGTGASYGFAGLTELAGKLEQAAKANNKEESAGELEQLTAYLSRVRLPVP